MDKEIVVLLTKRFNVSTEILEDLEGHFIEGRLYRAIKKANGKVYEIIIDENIGKDGVADGYVTNTLNDDLIEFIELTEDNIFELSNQFCKEDLEKMTKWITSENADIQYLLGSTSKLGDKNEAEKEEVVTINPSEFSNIMDGIKNNIIIVEKEDPLADEFLLSVYGKLIKDITEDTIRFSEVAHFESRTKEPYIFMMLKLMELYNIDKSNKEMLSKLLIQATIYCINEYKRLWQDN